jgi:hypothetical protein
MTQELSKRAQQMLDRRDFLDYYTMLCMHDSFDQDTNKEVSSKQKFYVINVDEKIVLMKEG